MMKRMKRVKRMRGKVRKKRKDEMEDDEYGKRKDGDNEEMEAKAKEEKG